MRFIIKDIQNVSKRERTAAGIVSVFVSIGIILLIDGSMGVPLRTSLLNIAITMVASVVFLYGFGKIIVHTRFADILRPNKNAPQQPRERAI